jgi:hypothetical protein
VRRFVPNFAEITKPISDMLNKDHDLKWSDEAKKAFDDIKQALCHSHVLISPNYAKDFQIFYFASDSTMADMLLQKNNDGLEQPIAFMSKTLQGVELNYKSMEKQAYALVKGLAHFRPYFWNSRIVAYVPHPMVKDILVQKDCNGTKGRWITKIQEYDLEVRPTKLVRGQRLAKLIAEKNLEAMEDQQVSAKCSGKSLN